MPPGVDLCYLVDPRRRWPQVSRLSVMQQESTILARTTTYGTLGILLALLSACAKPIPAPDLTGVMLWVNSPAFVEVGEIFTFEAHIRNASGKTITLETIDIGNSYLEKVAILETNPEHYSRSDVSDGTTAFWYEMPVGDGQYLIVEFKARAAEAGIHQGNFDFCIDSVNYCEYRIVTTPTKIQP